MEKDFLFGAATSAYQIEGAAFEDGRGLSIWDHFSQQRNKVVGGDTGNRACNHYHLWQQDVALMKALNLGAYRFSIAWPRVQPDGQGKVNQRGLDFYSRLVDGLLEANITPFITLFHWDLPLALYQLNKGFVHRDTCQRFADYVEIVVGALGDRVKNWITINEPFEHAAFGYLLGSHAPGHHSLGQFLSVMHHQLLAHGMAVERIRALSAKAQVGITLSLTPILPATERKKDVWAASFGNQLLNHITLSPLLKGGYPTELLQRLQWFWPKMQDNDLAVISQPTDFVGVNHYNCEYASHRWYVPFLKSWITGSKPGIDNKQGESEQHTAMGWEVNPNGMRQVLSWLREDYGNPPTYITENGAAYTDVLANGQVHDPLRMQYLKTHIAAVMDCRAKGSDVRGYFAWSLLDNFEWATGYSKRFGLVYVDYPSQHRVIKESGHWYGNFIRSYQQQGGVDNVGT
ncbi:GH1 family beta-glucosidase [Gallaecimonas mangrovi]|uniref:GH1 family beta-glucosidase n=1 Tax=Gallaecimonas mangrovi TaxID=2291597 RepID=UPI000E1FB821|nr:GH1 family beta-glucosidase [Gallaecimonas mangrovi]